MAQKLSRFEIASKQLETAVELFLDGRDLLSAVTLAGSADAILSALVVKAGKEPFVDLVRKLRELETGATPSRGEVTTFMNNFLSINEIKHLDPKDPDHIEINLMECAIVAIGKAAANYRVLDPSDPPFIQAYFKWTEDNLDCDELIERFGPKDRSD